MSSNVVFLKMVYKNYVVFWKMVPSPLPRLKNPLFINTNSVENKWNIFGLLLRLHKFLHYIWEIIIDIFKWWLKKLFKIYDRHRFIFNLVRKNHAIFQRTERRRLFVNGRSVSVVKRRLLRSFEKWSVGLFWRRSFCMPPIVLWHNKMGGVDNIICTFPLEPPLSPRTMYDHYLWDLWEVTNTLSACSRETTDWFVKFTKDFTKLLKLLKSNKDIRMLRSAV